ncbi:(2Fe-2S)-binding protein [Saxibacter everestensis]|uniref:(2Fe-2S)-binding protein n=1 Tax=Saxibacter everestensis TaxID=2909229 RepID=A0ABY8QRN2_9MICO|nr:(2Fe-2S)-binding protein [Brevibacteriaceae bacterium ZFBP1038]
MTTFSFDDRDVPFRPGQTIGGALMADGTVSWRSTRNAGKPRGLFCGIGVCFDCLLIVDGQPNERACLVPARNGMSVQSQEGTGRDDQAV